MLKKLTRLFMGILFASFLLPNVSSSALLGDFNNDGIVSISEVQTCINSFLGVNTTYSTAKILPLTVTSTTAFTLTGSDTSGGTWSGSMQMRGDGATVFEGQNVTKVSQMVTLSLLGGGVASSSIASYYRTNGVLYKAVYSGSTSGTATQTNNATMPATFKIGDFASGPTLTLNLNSAIDTVSTTYQVVSGGNSNAKVISTMTYQVANYSATTEYIISPTGDILSLKMILYYPSLNKTVTLNGT